MRAERWGNVRWAVASAAAFGLLVVGVVTLWERVLRWAPCKYPLTSFDAAGSLPQACLDAMSSTSPGDRLLPWLLCILLALTVVLAGRRTRGWIALVIVVVANPILDPGYVWNGWAPTADATPGMGVMVSLAVIIAAFIAVSEPRPRRAKADEAPVSGLAEGVALSGR